MQPELLLSKLVITSFTCATVSVAKGGTVRSQTTWDEVRANWQKQSSDMDLVRIRPAENFSHISVLALSSMFPLTFRL